jgi:flagellar basal body P-ring formation protein FlgA
MSDINKIEQTTSKQNYAWRETILFVVLLMSLCLMQEALATSANQFVKQDLTVLKHKIEVFLVEQSAGYAGEIKVTAGAIDPNLQLAACFEPEVFFPPGSRAWGKTSVGIQCNAPTKWKIYAQANVSIKAQYLIAAHPLSQGHTMTNQDIAFAEGDLTKLPAGVFTEARQIIGQTVRSPMMAGSVLRQNTLQQALAVQQGQTVLLTTSGTGFTINAEGKALKNANLGQVVPVKVQSGQVVNGIAREDGKVEVRF